MLKTNKRVFKVLTGLILAVLLFVTACSQSNNGRSEESSNLSPMADLILRNGVIYTVNEAQPWAEAVVVKDGVIIFVGTNDEVIAYEGAETQVLDLEGRMVMPGIHDSHLHPLEAGSPVTGTCLLEPNTPPEAFIPTFRRCAPDQIGTDWVLGFGHSIQPLLESERPPIDILDEAIPDRPVAILAETSHSVWVNSAALTAAGIDSNTPDPPGGVIDRDPETGKLTGILFDNAGDLVYEIALARTEELDELNYDGLLYSLKKLPQKGITSIAEARVYWTRGHLNAWQQAEREGTLSTRTVLGLWAYPQFDDDEQIAQLISMYDDDPDSLLRVTQVKMYSDGLIQNGTAALLEPYQLDFELPGNVGLNYFDQERLTRYVTELERAGFDLHIHTIGDRAVREALNAIEAAQATNGDVVSPRHRLTHLELIHPDDRSRFAELGVIADFQVAGEFALPEHAGEAAPLIGDRAFDMIPVRSIYNTGAVVTLSSDWDVNALSPFVGMEHALMRGEQSLPDLEAVIQAYTLNAAYLMRQQEQTGSIEVGKLADLIVIDQNIFEISQDKISNTKVQLTLLGGEVVYQHPSFSLR